jgi:hypothetical protein
MGIAPGCMAPGVCPCIIGLIPPLGWPWGSDVGMAPGADMLCGGLVWSCAGVWAKAGYEAANKIDAAEILVMEFMCGSPVK